MYHFLAMSRERQQELNFGQMEDKKHEPAQVICGDVIKRQSSLILV